MAKQITITQDDYGIDVSSQFIMNSLPLNLVNKTVKVILVYPDSTKKEYNGNIVDAVNGVVDLILTSEMTAQAGLYKLYYKLLDIESNITAQNTVTYYVLAKDGGV